MIASLTLMYGTPRLRASLDGSTADSKTLRYSGFWRLAVRMPCFRCPPVSRFEKHLSQSVECCSQALGNSFVQGVTPGVLRGSGATYSYLETEDLSKVAWPGRWARQKTVEFYLQEVAAQVILQRLPAECRNKISDLRPLAAKLMAFYSSVVPKHPDSG